MIAKSIRKSVVVLLLMISVLSPSSASAFTHLCFYGPSGVPGWPLNPTLNNHFTVTLAESLVVDKLFMRNTETSGATVIGGELFETPNPSAGTKKVILFSVPFAAVWKLVGEGWMEGNICGWGGVCFHFEIPNPQPSLCFAQGVVVP